MSTRKEIKKRARSSVKRHLLVWILLCALFVWLSGESMFINPTFAESSSEATSENLTISSSSALGDRLAQMIVNFGEGKLQDNQDMVDRQLQDSVESSRQNRILGRSRGVLAAAINRVSSGSFFLVLGNGIHSILGSGVATAVVGILLSMGLALAVWVFVRNILDVVLARMFLEGHLYDKVHLARLLYVFRSGQWVNVALGKLLQQVYLYLWSLTVVGGIIKHYSYFLVPYILAENPRVKPKEAILLSRQLMYGHKWALCKLELSFLGWELLNALTFGVLGLVYLRPYETAAYCEFYIDVRDQGIHAGIDNTHLLHDRYLYQFVSDKSLDTAYADVARVLERSRQQAEAHPLHGVHLVLARYFGVTVRKSEAEQAYAQRMADEEQLFFEGEAYRRETYPARLNPLGKERKTAANQTVNPLRCYSVWSLILIFFVTSFVGWLWEVSLHLISDGVFVNRGVLHGPWLPIYGSGCVLILVVLRQFRKNPAMELGAIVVLCGLVEYFTAYFLELTHGGTKWWDYSGYFLNLHGRICAEGLLVFGMGGLAVVYFVAPMLDNLFGKLKSTWVAVACCVLLAGYLGDTVYSQKHPNTGEGITDYTSSVQPEPEMPILQISLQGDRA